MDAATVELKAYLDNRKTGKPNDWPSKVGRFLAGQLTESDFLKAAEDTNPRTDQEQHCEAYFYAGSKRLIEDDKTTATDYFKKCLATDVKHFEEYQSADAEMKFLLGSPTKSK
jgi:lipoprotein NlpI